jgi:hypothetical protein
VAASGRGGDWPSGRTRFGSGPALVGDQGASGLESTRCLRFDGVAVGDDEAGPSAGGFDDIECMDLVRSCNRAVTQTSAGLFSRVLTLQDDGTDI